MAKSGVEQQVLEKISKDKIAWADLQFVDITGALQHITVNTKELDEESFNTGVGKLDGSSIKGFKSIFESDMVLSPDAGTYNVIPWEEKTARFFCDIKEGGTGKRFEKDSRLAVERAQSALESAGFTKAYFGPELEFFVFDSVTFDHSLPIRGQGYSIESKEAAWTSGGTNHPIQYKTGYYPATPQDTLQNLRTKFVNSLENDFGIFVEAHHHEVATAGQCEINVRFDEMRKMADKVVTYKYVIKNLSAANGQIATFMPKPLFGDNGSGMHTHQSLWKGDKNAFFDASDSYAQLSQECRYYIGGIISHGAALAAFTNPITNSYKRLVPGYEAPVYLAWSKRNRSAAIRIPNYFGGSDKATRLEYRSPDPACNPYLSFAALIAAGLDGIKKKIEPGDPVDQDIFELSASERRELGIKELPGSLKESLECLESDKAFLSGVLSSDLIESYSQLKFQEFKNESIHPTPWEFKHYLNV
ncbi:type I glutamate--ammonia ligase [Candidatus Micrarchaeota archaeon]|nr:type I glutamate--ammonia ligase [Candidatus Micrarchaeota archaeon]